MAIMLFAACTTTQSLENPNDFREESAALTLEEEKALNQKEVDGFNKFIADYKSCLSVEREAVKCWKN